MKIKLLGPLVKSCVWVIVSEEICMLYMSLQFLSFRPDSQKQEPVGGLAMLHCL